jgi:hypothetical protein
MLLPLFVIATAMAATSAEEEVGRTRACSRRGIVLERALVRLNRRKVGNGDIAVYFQNRAYFTKRGLNKQTVLHELYHHLVYVNELEMSERQEERNADRFATNF